MMGEIVSSIDKFIAYIFPGVVSLGMYHFIDARKARVDRSKFLLIISLGYFYTSIYSYLSGIKDVEQYTIYDKGMLFLLALFVPVLFNYLKSISKNEIEEILAELNIGTVLDDSIFEQMFHLKDKLGKLKMHITIYSSNSLLKYEGDVYSFDVEGDVGLIICLEKYKIYRKKVGDSTTYDCISSNTNKYLYVKATEVECIEIEYV